MKTFILALLLVLPTDIVGHEDLLSRIDRLDEQLEILLSMYDELSSCGDEKCMRKVREKYIVNNKYQWDEMVFGSKNTVVEIRKLLLKNLIQELQGKAKKNPNDQVVAEKIRRYESQLKKLFEFEGYD